jgi:hypothetical protein
MPEGSKLCNKKFDRGVQNPGIPTITGEIVVQVQVTWQILLLHRALRLLRGACACG